MTDHDIVEGVVNRIHAQQDAAFIMDMARPTSVTVTTTEWEAMLRYFEPMMDKRGHELSPRNAFFGLDVIVDDGPLPAALVARMQAADEHPEQRVPRRPRVTP